MTSITDVLHLLVRRGLALRIETDGTLFIYDPRRYTRGADAEVGRHLPAKTQALSARAERRLLSKDGQVLWVRSRVKRGGGDATITNATSANLLNFTIPRFSSARAEARIVRIYLYAHTAGATTITATLPGLAPVTYEASFAGIPAVVPVSMTLTHDRDGTLP